MKITTDEVRHVARLARLTISGAEADKLAHEMADIIAFADRLNEVDTTGIMPTNHAIKVENVFRADVVGESYDRDELLKNAPERQAGCYLVPKIVE